MWPPRFQTNERKGGQTCTVRIDLSRYRASTSHSGRWEVSQAKLIAWQYVATSSNRLSSVPEDSPVMWLGTATPVRRGEGLG